MPKNSFLRASLLSLFLPALPVPGAAQGGAAQGGRVLSLAGTWRFATDSGDRGLREEWFRKTLDGAIHLPGTTDEAGVGKPGPERFGVLTRRHEYIGPAWYQKTFQVPPGWKGKEILVFLERVLWESRAWIDGRRAGPPLDSFAAPHLHNLGMLEPGKHTLTLRIDNRMIHHLGLMSHSYGPQTQSRWNGVVGRIELRALPPLRFGLVRVFPARKGGNWSLSVEASLTGKAPGGVEAAFRVVDPESGLTLGEGRRPWKKGEDRVRETFEITSTVIPWSEFTPRLYEARLELLQGKKVLDRRTLSFGFREVSHQGNRLLLNGVPVFMRGNLDCIHFPLTGYPSTKKEDWLRIFSLYKEHGLNHVRFHSWCPPEAAFDAADEMGIYIQASVGIWINEGRKEGLGPGKGEKSVDDFAKAEMRRIVDTYGNHPSFLFLVIGNELGHSNFKVTGRWIRDVEAYDPRRLYAASTARTITPYCEFNATHVVPGIGWVRQHIENGTAWDYESKYSKTKVPIIAHEIGQWPVYPDWDLCEKFTGVLRNTRLEKMREAARAAGIFGQQADFTRASGALNRLLYKDEIESFLRTPSCRGFQLLSMEDFQGQGEAYVGWLDMFWDSKGIVLPQRFRGYCAPRVALAKIPKYTWKGGETFSFQVLVRNDGPSDLEKTAVDWLIRDPQKRVLKKGRVTGGKAARGAVVEVGEVKFPWKEVFPGKTPRRLQLVLRLRGKPEQNTYPLWVYPDVLPPADFRNVLRADKLDAGTLRALEGGARVFLDAHRLGDPDFNRKLAAWRPLYWSLAYFSGQAETLGLLVRGKHPAFRDFPTEDFGDWQWREICRGARGFDLTGLVPPEYRPIAQPVPDFHAPRKIGTLFEFKVGRGSLFVCGYDLSEKRCKARPEIRQLRYSLLRYVAGPEFHPSFRVDPSALKKLFRGVETLPFVKGPDLSNALFHLDCGGAHPKEGGYLDYDPSRDRIALPGPVSYKVQGRLGTWKDGHCTAWIIGSRTVVLELDLPKGFQGKLFLHFSDWNKNSREGRITLEGREIFRLGRHDGNPKGVWTALDLDSSMTSDGKVLVGLRRTRGSNLMLTDVALFPR